ncbi:metal-dependent transcriptional regulator [Chitinophagaceae bacterium LB-8]|uniref:Transcriptional regulator MntR n=1 Tax=Paraflavisolibacter caeni TaxID=2982496 RepID=A0A9X2XZU8_9BACT|nr:metal-dependent transcriptional regulator [Paraflavisolibacter caeni]MCU7550503.1 metal-dependent transcriptional regulator [Paraflavisolibacter caeni]
MQHFTHHSEENYLKTLYKLENGKVKKVNNIALSKALELNPATVLEMVRKMAERQLVELLADKTIQLTDKGRKKALQIIRKHRLWEVFLVDKLNYKWNEVHDLAEQLEHIESDDLIQRLEAFLGFPSVDPHGDPIPDEHGKLKKIKTQPLSDAPIKKKVTVASLANSSNEFLKYLDKAGISIGDKLEVLEVEAFDGSMKVLHKKSSITLSNEAASNILVVV